MSIKKLLSVIFTIALTCSASSRAADTSISALPAASSASSSDIFPVTQFSGLTGTTRKVSFQQLLDMISTIGNANTCTALAADPPDCSVGQAARGIGSSGAASGCWSVPTNYLSDSTNYAGSASQGGAATSALQWNTPRSLAGNGVDGSMDVAFSNKFVVGGTTDIGLSGAQFLGSLSTGILKNTTTTGALSIAVAGDFPTLNQSTTGSAAKWSNVRNLAGNSVDGSTNVAFSNKFVVEGTTDSGLSGAQFLGSLGTGILKNTTTTGALTVAVAGDFPTLNQDTTGKAAKADIWTNARNLAGNSVDGSANVAFSNKFLVQGTADSGLSGAQFLGALSTGLMKVTTTTGVVSVAAASDLPAHASSHQNGGSDEIATATPGANAIPKANSSGFLPIGWLSMNTGKLLGRTTASNGVVEEISVSGCTLSASTLTCSSSGVAGPGSSTDKGIPSWNGTGGTTLQNNSGITAPASDTLQLSTLQGSTAANGVLSILGSTNASKGNVEIERPVIGVHGTTTSSTQGSFTVPAGTSTDYRPAMVAFLNQTIPDSITRSASTATLTMTNNPGFGGATFIGTITGADQPEYNGTFVFTRTSCGAPCVYTFTVAGAPASPATGNILVGKALFSLEDVAPAMGNAGGLAVNVPIVQFNNGSISGVDAITGTGTAREVQGAAGGIKWGTFAAAGTFTEQSGLTQPSSGVVSCDTSSDGNGLCEFQAATDTVKTANLATWKRVSNSELLTLSTSGTTTDTAANLLPAGCYIESVVARVTTTITTATNWKLGDATTAGRFTAADSTMTSGETQVGLVHRDQTGAAGPIQSAAAKVRVTTTGTPGAGVIRITAFASCFVAPTS